MHPGLIPLAPFTSVPSTSALGTNGFQDTTLKESVSGSSVLHVTLVTSEKLGVNGGSPEQKKSWEMLV